MRLDGRRVVLFAHHRVKLTIAMAADVSIGLAASSTHLTKTSTATFDNVTVMPATPTPPVAPPSAPPLPDGWLHQDIGAVGFTGDTVFDAAAARSFRHS